MNYMDSSFFFRKINTFSYEKGGDYTYKCPNCGWNIDQDEYVYDDGDPEPREWTDQMKKVFGDDVPPEGCIACGGPYPHCKSSCKVFDD